jgi:hypothetical protein
VQFPLFNPNGLTKESVALYSNLSGGPIKKKKICSKKGNIFIYSLYI